MPRPLRKQYPGAKYHVASRGNGRRQIFHNSEDCQKFMWQLEEALRLDGVVLYAYVLMRNHYHLLVETPRGNMSQFIHRLNTAYSTYYRYKHNHSGSVLQAGSRCPLVEGDDYLIRLTRYIHLNPIKIRSLRGSSAEEKVNRLNGHKWSSYGGYILKTRENALVNYRWRGLVGGRVRAGQRRAYRAYVEAMLNKDDDVLAGAQKASIYAIGNAGFVAEVEEEMKARARGEAVASDVIGPQEELLPIDEIDKAVCSVYDCKVPNLRKHGHAVGQAKGVAIEMACRYAGLTNREAGIEYGGISGAAVGYQRRKLASLLDKNTKAQKEFQRAVRRLEDG